VNCQLDHIEFEDFSMTTSVLKRGDSEVHTVYVVAGPKRVTLARASGPTAVKAMENLLEITSR
jgi:hypothetical protein